MSSSSSRDGVLIPGKWHRLEAETWIVDCAAGRRSLPKGVCAKQRIVKIFNEPMEMVMELVLGKSSQR